MPVRHCAKSVRIRSFSGPYFPAFRLNTDQNNSEYGYAVRVSRFWQFSSFSQVVKFFFRHFFPLPWKQSLILELFHTLIYIKLLCIYIKLLYVYYIYIKLLWKAPQNVAVLENRELKITLTELGILFHELAVNIKIPAKRKRENKKIFKTRTLNLFCQHRGKCC